MGQGVRGLSDIVIISFAISIVSAAFGIAKLLKNGPIKLIRKDGKIGGYGQPGFILVMVIVAGNMIGKALWMAFGVFRLRPTDKITSIWIWVLACILPQALLVNFANTFLKTFLRKLFFADNLPVVYQFWPQTIIEFG